MNTYKQVIEVKNTHQHDIKVQVEDQLPRSEDQKIKVTDMIHVQYLQAEMLNATIRYACYPLLPTSVW